MPGWWAEFWPEVHFHAPQPLLEQSKLQGTLAKVVLPGGGAAWCGGLGIQEWGATSTFPPPANETRVGILPILVDPWAQK